MARLNILKDPNPLLRKISKPVTDFSPRLHELLDDMTETMGVARGVGLAAPQVGVLYRAAVLLTKEFGIVEIINPVITSATRKKIAAEGCLSIPGINGRVMRPHLITVEFVDRNGRPQTLTLQGLDAVAAGHEIDHLNGILFTDKLVD
jgi:peptide deformylase